MSLGKQQEAQKFYNDTVEYYLQEQGLRPTSQLTELMNKLGSQIEHSYAVLDDIQSCLTLEDEDEAEAVYNVFMEEAFSEDEDEE